MTLPDVLRAPLTLPVMAAPLFIVSGPELVIAQCTAGVIGSFPALNARPASALPEWLARVRSALDEHDRADPSHPSAPFAVNLIVHRSNGRLESDLAAVVAAEVPIVITSLGARADVNEAIHSYGGVVLHDVISDRFARKAVEKGADGLVAVAAGAGGHAGTTSPFALVREIRAWFDGPLLLSGSLAHGSSILAAQVAGADLAYVGSAFLATHEASAPDAYKDMVVASAADDIVYSNLFTGIHGNYLRGSVAAAGLDPDQLETA
ncbi:MAG: nitronate monooxygenase, partial [Actinomycetales bacterium]